MTQQGTIKKLLPGGRAEVEVTRRSACGHDCAKCGGCGGLETQTLYVTARTQTDAGIGDRVLIEGETGRVLGLGALVYMLPLVLFFIGYAIGNAAGGGAAGALAGGVLFALLAAVPGYFLAVRLVKRYRAARERRRQKKAAEKKL